MTDYFHVSMELEEINKISNLGLAHIGDAVYELMVRSWLCIRGKATSKGLHAATVSYVRAPAQAAAAGKLLPELTESERGVYKRGRNSRVNSVPQKSTLEEYHAATGLEALFGWLYLQGKTDRLNEILSIIMED